MKTKNLPAESTTGTEDAGRCESRADSRQYQISYLDPFQIPRHGFFWGKGTLTINAAGISLSGAALRGCFAFLWVPLTVAFITRYPIRLLGFTSELLRDLINFIIIVVCLFVLHYKWNYFWKNSVYKRAEISNVVRNGRKIGFEVPGPGGTSEPRIKLRLKARNEEEASQIENELRVVIAS